MNKQLRKELALLAGVLAAATMGRKSKLVCGFLAAGAAGLFLSTLKNNFSFRGKTVYITGGSRGFGLSLAWNLLKEGAIVTLVARDRSELQSAKDILLRDFPQAKIYLSPCDITERRHLQGSIEHAIHQMGGIDLLINNAGAILVGPFTSLDKQDFEAQLRVHFYVAVDATKIILPHFQERGAGHILNICSLGGKVAVPHMIAYDASKFALAGFSQGIGAELSRYNICVTTAFPTVMRTGSPIQAVFKGDHEKEFAWFQTLDNLPFISMSADVAAKKILQAVAEGRSELILSTPAKLREFIAVFFPEIANAFLSFANHLLPNKDSKVLKTGSQSASLFRRIPLLNGGLNPQKQEERYNQTPHRNPKFNLGLH